MTGRMVGQTRDVGWEIGVRRTVPYPVDAVWELLTGPAGLALWLGEGARLGSAKGDQYRTADGTTGELRSRHERSRLRLTWRPADWDHTTILQVTLTGSGPDDRTTIGFHQEWLADAAEREHQREHWRRVMDSIVEALGAD